MILIDSLKGNGFEQSLADPCVMRILDKSEKLEILLVTESSICRRYPHRKQRGGLNELVQATARRNFFH